MSIEEKLGGGEEFREILVMAQDWEELFPGYDSEPRGYSLHMNKRDLKRYCSLHRSYFIKETGQPYRALVSSELYSRLERHRPGIMFRAQPTGVLAREKP